LVSFLQLPKGFQIEEAKLTLKQDDGKLALMDDKNDLTISKCFYLTTLPMSRRYAVFGKVGIAVQTTSANCNLQLGEFISDFYHPVI
jgi:hypothetical protein